MTDQGLDQTNITTFPGLVEDQLLIFSQPTLDLLYSQPNPAELLGLYTFYLRCAKKQKTNQPWCTDKFTRQGLGWGRARMENIQNQLLNLGLIQKVVRKNEKGQITGWYIRLRYKWRQETEAKKITEVVNESPIQMSGNPQVDKSTSGQLTTNAYSGNTGNAYSDLNRNAYSTPLSSPHGVDDSQLDNDEYLKRETGKEVSKRQRNNEVLNIFQYWQATHNHPRSKLTPDRRRRIEKWLKHYDVETLKQAIQGCTYSDWHMGDNPSGKPYNGIEQIFKSADHIEGFADYCENPPKKQSNWGQHGGPKRTIDDLIKEEERKNGNQNNNL